jgi:hypothetical protein
VLGEREALVLEVTPFDVHGVPYVDLRVVYRDRSVDAARLGRESIPDGLAAGDEVLVSTALNMIVAVRRPEVDPSPPGGS